MAIDKFISKEFLLENGFQQAETCPNTDFEKMTEKGILVLRPDSIHGFTPLMIVENRWAELYYKTINYQNELKGLLQFIKDGAPVK